MFDLLGWASSGNSILNRSYITGVPPKRKRQVLAKGGAVNKRYAMKVPL
jgi:hypothetical protein